MEELEMTYAAMGLPFEFDSFNKLSARQAEKFFQWYIGQIECRMNILKDYIHKENKNLLFDYSPESLISLWEWYEHKIIIEKKTEEELKNEYGRYPDWMRDEISKTKVSSETLDIGMDLAIYFAEVIRKQYPDKLHWGYFTKPKKKMYVNQPVLLGFKNDKPLCAGQIIKVCTFRSSEVLQKTRLYDLYIVWINLIN